MKSTSRIIRKSAVLTASTALLLSIGGTAAAAGRTDLDNLLNEDLVASSSGLTSAEEAQLAHDLEVLFTRYIQLEGDGTFRLNESNLISDGYAANIGTLSQLVDLLNTPAPAESTQPSSSWEESGSAQLGAGDFALCMVVEGLGIPSAAASPGLIAAIKQGISAWNWGLTAKTVARLVGPSVAKALGGPVGIGVTLGWAAWSCKSRL